MARLQILGCLLACILSASAQSNCAQSGTLTLSDAAAATALASKCATWTGSIALDGSDLNSSLSIAGLKLIQGNLSINNIPLGSRLTTSSLNVTGSVNITSSYTNDLSFDSVGGSFNAYLWHQDSGLQTIPGGRQAGFVRGNVTIDQTLLYSTGYTGNGIETNLADSEFHDINITNSPQLNEVSVFSITSYYDINVSGNISPSNTGPSISIESSKESGNLRLSGIKSLSADGLNTIWGVLRVTDSALTELSLPSVKTTQDNITIANTQISKITLASLTAVNGSVLISNNTQLISLGGGFLNLQQILGDLTITGPIKDVSFGSLTAVSGVMDIKSSVDMSCANVAAKYKTSTANGGPPIVAGYLNCNSANETIKTGTGVWDGSVVGGSPAKSGLSTGAAAGLGVGIAVVVLGGVLALWLWRRQRARKHALISPEDADPEETVHETFNKKGIPYDNSPTGTSETAYTGYNPIELNGENGVSELASKYDTSLQSAPRDTKNYQELYSNPNEVQPTGRYASQTSYGGATQFRYEAPGDEHFPHRYDKDNMSIVEETAISKAQPTMSPHSPTIVSIRSSIPRSADAPPVPEKDLGSSIISPSSSISNRASHFRENMSPVSANTEESSHVHGTQETLDTLQPHSGAKQQPLDHANSVSSLAATERSVAEDEKVGLLSPGAEHTAHPDPR